MIYHVTRLIGVETKCYMCRQRGNYWNALRQANNGNGCFQLLQALWQSIVLNRDFNADKSCNVSVKEELIKILGEVGRHLFTNSFMKAVNIVGKLRQASWERSAKVRMLKLQLTLLQRKWSLMGGTAKPLSLFPFSPSSPFSPFLWSREKNWSSLKEDSKGS